MYCSSRILASAASGRVFAPSHHHRRKAGQAWARCSAIASPGPSSSHARTVREMPPACGACSHGVPGHGPVAQSAEATRRSHERQSDQSASSTHCRQSSQRYGGPPWSAVPLSSVI